MVDKLSRCVRCVCYRSSYLDTIKVFIEDPRVDRNIVDADGNAPVTGEEDNEVFHSHEKYWRNGEWASDDEYSSGGFSGPDGPSDEEEEVGLHAHSEVLYIRS